MVEFRQNAKPLYLSFMEDEATLESEESQSLGSKSGDLPAEKWQINTGINIRYVPGQNVNSSTV